MKQKIIDLVCTWNGNNERAEIIRIIRVFIRG